MSPTPVLDSMIYPRGTRVKSRITGYKGTVTDYDDGTYTIDYDKLGIKRLQPAQYTEPLPNALKYLVIHKPTEEQEAAIVYLLSAAATTKLTLEAKNKDVDMAVRDQYKTLTGVWLEEGNGYHVAPESARKQGCQGSISFKVSPEHERALSGLNMRKPGFIDNLALLWLLVERGLRVTR